MTRYLLPLCSVPQRDPRFERETSASELEIRIEMNRRLAAYFEKKHRTPHEWCAVCREWGVVHEHQAVGSG